ncbi:L-lactate dehydrogenase, partial [Aerococcus sp. L_32]
NRVIGSGTSLDSARFRQELATTLDVDARNVHAYIMGEHGDTEFPVWSHANIGGQSIYDWVSQTSAIDEEALVNLFYHVRDKAYKIIEKKGATYYGIGVSLVRILKAILNDENAILPVSVYLDGEYNQNDVYIGAPAIINREGIRGIIEADLNDHEKQQMELSATKLRD